MQITGKSSGKSGGARIITSAKVVDEKIFGLSFYYKAEQSNIQEPDL